MAIYNIWHLKSNGGLRWILPRAEGTGPANALERTANGTWNSLVHEGETYLVFDPQKNPAGAVSLFTLKQPAPAPQPPLVAVPVSR